MATADGEEKSKAGGGKEEGDAAAPLSEAEEAILRAAIVWNVAVKVVVLVLAGVFCVASFIKWYHDKNYPAPPRSPYLDSHPYFPLFFAIFCGAILGTAVVGFVLNFKFKASLGWPLPGGFELRGKPKDFPSWLLLLDFLNLALLVTVTGRWESIFILVFPIALLLGDVSFMRKSNTRRWLVGLLFAVCMAGGVLLPEIGRVRYLLMGSWDTTDVQSLWVFGRKTTMLLGVLLSVSAALFASFVVNWYKEKAGRPSGQETSGHEPNAQPDNHSG
jgi:hypothetical protein